MLAKAAAAIEISMTAADTFTTYRRRLITEKVSPPARKRFTCVAYMVI